MTREQAERAKQDLQRLKYAMDNVADRARLYDDVRHEDLAALRTAWQRFNGAIWDHVTGDRFKAGETSRPTTVLDHPSMPDDEMSAHTRTFADLIAELRQLDTASLERMADSRYATWSSIGGAKRMAARRVLRERRTLDDRLTALHQADERTR